MLKITDLVELTSANVHNDDLLEIIDTSDHTTMGSTKGTNKKVKISSLAAKLALAGATGVKGDPGTNGTNGTNGATGATGVKGDPGTNGTNGLNGTSSIKAWVSFNGQLTDANIVDADGAVGNRFIYSSENVSSVNRYSQGAFIIYFAAGGGMANTDYCVVVTDDANGAHRMGGVLSKQTSHVIVAYSQINTSSAKINPFYGNVVVIA